jgi:hypothetical protein
MTQCYPAAAILLLGLAPPGSMRGQELRPHAPLEAGVVLPRLTIASFGGSGTNSIQALATDAEGNVLVAGTTSSPNFPTKNAFQPTFRDASVLRSIDLGNTWTRVAAPLDVASIFPDPVAPQVLFAGGAAGIYKSADGGQTWQMVYSFPSGVSLQSLTIDPGNHLRVAALTVSTTSHNLIRSLDGGATWSTVNPPSSFSNHLVADPTGSGTLMAVAPLFISHDWGLTFTELSPPGPGDPTTVAFDPSHQGWIYADFTGGAAGMLFLSTDFGVTWTTKASPPTTFSNIQELAVDPSVPTTLVAMTADGLYLSVDGASTWTRQLGTGFPDGIPFALVSHQCSPSGGLFGILNEGEIAFSPDDGDTFETPRVTGTSVTTGPGCAAYVTRSVGTSSDAFVAKLSPAGEVIWSTFLGGSEVDTAAGLAVDAQGSAYVTGTTYSSDFPSTVARIGVEGTSSVFVTKFWADGTLAYSVLIGGESSNSAIAIAIDSNQNAYAIGSTESAQFPVTPGVLVNELMPGSYTGFLVKLSAGAAELTGTYLGPSDVYATSIFVGADGEPVLAGTGGPPGLPSPPEGTVPEFVMKLDRTASQVISEIYIPGTNYGGPTALSADAQGNLVLVGSSGAATSGAYVSPPSWSACYNIPGYPPPI